MESSTPSNIYNTRCVQCIYFDQRNGICSKIYENIHINPAKILKKCNGIFFKMDWEKAVYRKERNGNDFEVQK